MLKSDLLLQDMLHEGKKSYRIMLNTTDKGSKKDGERITIAHTQDQRCEVDANSRIFYQESIRVLEKVSEGC